MSNIEMNVYLTQQRPSHELTYFDVKDASDELYKKKDALAEAIRALREYRKHELVLEYKVKQCWESYKKIVNQRHVLSNVYIEQCKKRNVGE